MGRKSNFNPGPAVLPEDVLKQAQSDMMNFRGLGTGIMEISHRSKEFIALLEHTQATLRRLLSLDESTHILFCQGGARTQFAMVPMNFLHTSGAYVDTGVWSDKAIEESQRVGDTKVIATSKEQKYNHIPPPTLLHAQRRRILPSPHLQQHHLRHTGPRMARDKRRPTDRRYVLRYRQPQARLQPI